MLYRLITVLIGSFVIVFLGLFCLVRFLERTSFFFPSKFIDYTPDQIGLVYEDLYLTTLDGVKMNAWLVKSTPKAATLIFAHGNAGNIGDRLMKIKFWHDLGLNILIFDYRGYGQSQGIPTEKGVYLDAQAAYDYVQNRLDTDHHRIIGYGESLGGAVMIDLATQRKLAGLIIESSFTSAGDMAQRYYPLLPSFMMGIKFDSLSKIRNITIPKLFLHSPEDQTVPLPMGQKLYGAARPPKNFLLIHGGHNDITFITDSKIKDSVKNFLQTHSWL